MKSEVDYADANDGMWYIALEDFYRTFYRATANPNIDSYHHSHFAAFDVDTPESHTEEVKITSAVDQIVYISAYSYDTQFIRNGDCYDEKIQRYELELWFRINGRKRWLGWRNAYHEPAINMKAGESLEVVFEAYWPPQDHSPHDYSIVAWSEKQAVTFVSEHDH